MAKFARVEDGVVREVIEAEELPPFAPEIERQFVMLPDDSDVAEHWLVDGGGKPQPPPAAPPPAPKPPSIAALAARLDDLERRVAALEAGKVAAAADVTDARA